MVPQHRLLVWNSRRGPHLGSGHVRPHQQTGHMIAIASIRRCSSLVGRGPSTYGSRLSLRSVGMTTEETAPYAIAPPLQGGGIRWGSQTPTRNRSSIILSAEHVPPAAGGAVRLRAERGALAHG